MTINDAAREVLEGPYLAHMVTLNADGSPQVSVVWVGLDGEEIVAGHLGSWRKLDNVRRDPRVALSIEVGSRNDIGLDEYLVVHGRARVTEGGAPDLLRRLAHTYIPSEADFLATPDCPPGWVTHVTVDRIGGVGPWA